MNKQLYCLSILAACMLFTRGQSPTVSAGASQFGCSCAVRCCPDAFTPRRPNTIFHLPNVYSIGCCGCVFCPSSLSSHEIGPPVFLTMVLPRPTVEIEYPEPTEVPEPPEQPEPIEHPEPVEINAPEQPELPEIKATEIPEIELKGVGGPEIEGPGFKIEGR